MQTVPKIEENQGQELSPAPLRDRCLCPWRIPPGEEVRRVTRPFHSCHIGCLVVCAGRKDRNMLALEIRPPSPASGTEALPALRGPQAPQGGYGAQRTGPARRLQGPVGKHFQEHLNWVGEQEVRPWEADSILLSPRLEMIRSATPFPLVSLFFMFIGFILSNIGHIRPHRTILAFVSGIFFILSGKTCCFLSCTLDS